MKELNNKSAVLKFSGGQERPVTVAELLIECINYTPKGLQVQEIRKRIKVLERIEKAKDPKHKKIMLEDADYEVAKKCVEEMSWGIVDPFILEFTDMFK
jgi:hypothetical protein